MNGILNILDLGAKNDGVFDNSEIINKAILECKNKNGGCIYFPSGKYKTGPIKLVSNLTLHIESGAEIIFFDDFTLYKPVKTRWEGVECYGYSPLIYGYEVENVAITGRGVIDGQGKAWWEELRRKRKAGIKKPESAIELELAGLNPGYENAGSGGGGRETQFLRPTLLEFFNSKNISVEGVTLQNSPFWNTHPVYCSGVHFNNVTFKNPYDAPNTDGLDIDSCYNVRISNCTFDVGDDCLCIKSGIDKDGRRVARPTENVAITNCTMLHGHGGVVMGSEMAGSVRNITISNCIFIGTDRGIRIKSRRGRGGIIEDITASNIVMKDVLCPFTANLMYRCGAEEGDPVFSKEKLSVSEETPAIRNIKISDINARGVKSAAGFFYGLPEMPIENLTISNAYIEVSSNPEDKGGEPDMAFGFNNIEKKGIIAKYLKNCRFDNVTVKTVDGKGIELDQSTDVILNGFINKKYE